MIFNASPSLFYLSGLNFHLSERPVVLVICPEGSPLLVLPELELRKVSSVDFPIDVYPYPEEVSRWSQLFHEALGSRDLPPTARIGMEPRYLRLLEYNLLLPALPASPLHDGSHLISTMRAVKSAQEIELQQQAVDIAEQALYNILPQIKPGITEKEIGARLVAELFEGGSDAALPFSPIVSSGPNGANPHAAPSDRELTQGDLLIIDWGAGYQGYVSDLTRTFAIGPIDQKYQDIHRIVREANQAAREKAGPGIPCCEVDSAARSVITKAGYGTQFTHRTGHGLGLECHEEPYIRGDNTDILETGMSFTIEPGIYFEHENGVRIEDDVVITDTGAHSLSSFPRELMILG